MRSKPLYRTPLGAAYVGDSLKLLEDVADGTVDLVITSPPFALQRQKEYRNVEQREYVDWLLQFGVKVRRALKNTGSFVLDLGGAYKKGIPVRSLHNFRVLIRMCDEVGFHLAEDFYWFNPAKLPSPIEWVNKRKLRAKDSVNTIWWFGKTERPKANVSNVYAPFSDRMKALLKNPEGWYTAKKRPSGHDIGNGFKKSDKAGAIPSNLLQIANTESNSKYLRFCRAAHVQGHPARFPEKLPDFFIRFLTDEGDMVVDIFAGSNTTGAVCERLNRQWLAFDERGDYLASSAFRFLPEGELARGRAIYERLAANPTAAEKLPLEELYSTSSASQAKRGGGLSSSPGANPAAQGLWQDDVPANEEVRIS